MPDYIKSYRESAPDTIVVKGLDVHERTIVVQPKIRKVNYHNKVKLFFIMNNYEEKGNL